MGPTCRPPGEGNPQFQSCQRNADEKSGEPHHGHGFAACRWKLERGGARVGAHEEGTLPVAALLHPLGCVFVLAFLSRPSPSPPPDPHLPRSIVHSGRPAMAVAWIDDQSSGIPTTSQTNLRSTAQTSGRACRLRCRRRRRRRSGWQRRLGLILRRPNSDWNLIRYFMCFLCLKPSAGSSLASVDDWMCGS